MQTLRDVILDSITTLCPDLPREEAERIADEGLKAVRPSHREEDDDQLRVICRDEAGKPYSSKASNLRRRPLSVLEAAVAGGLAVTTLTTAWLPYLAAAIAMYLPLKRGLTIPLTELEAAVVWTLFVRGGLLKQIEEDALLECVNSALGAGGFAETPLGDLDLALSHLERIASITREQVDDAFVWVLVEDVDLELGI